MTGRPDERPETLVFDLDGTLVDSSIDITRAVNRMLAERGEERVRRDDVVPLLGEGATSLVAKVLSLTTTTTTTTDATPDEDLVAECTRRYLDFYAEVPVRDSTLYPAVAETLAGLGEAGVRMGICTNKGEALAVEVLEQLGVLAHFDCVVGGDSLPVRKPDPEPLLTAVRGVDGEPSRSALVGDSDIDRECALRAEVPFYLVPWASVSTAGHRLDDFADLLSPTLPVPDLTTPTRST
jgi:phosphoglycolate phosphatase